jgi:hypothetical protein
VDWGWRDCGSVGRSLGGGASAVPGVVDWGHTATVSRRGGATAVLMLELEGRGRGVGARVAGSWCRATTGHEAEGQRAPARLATDGLPLGLHGVREAGPLVGRQPRC